MITEWLFKVLDEYPTRIICSDGTFYNLKGKKLNLKPSKNKYLRIRMYKNGREFYKWAHRMVYHAFKGDPKGLEIHHEDKDVQNNYYINLTGLTPKKHRYYHKKKKVELYKPEELKDVPF